MMTSHTSREVDSSGYRRIYTDSDSDEEDVSSVPHMQQSERVQPNVHITSSVIDRHNLDRFVQNVYAYYRRGGLLCMLVEDILQLFQFALVIFFSFYLVECIDYDLLWRNSSLWPPNNASAPWWNGLPEDMRAWLERFMNGTGQDAVGHKLTLSDIMEPAGKCMKESSGFMLFLLLVALAVFVFRAMKFFARLTAYVKTRRFYREALGYADSAELDSATWNDVQHRLIGYCRRNAVLGGNVDELHVHQRLLRYRNYMIGLVTSDTLPIRVRVPFLGSRVYLSDMLKWNIEYALFQGPWSPFGNSEALPDAFTKRGAFATSREQLSASLGRHLLCLGMFNLLLCPFMALFQLLNVLFQYAAELRHNPAAMGARCWGNYARLRLRHYNEPDEQFEKRLALAYRPASDYLAGFRSRLTVIVARATMFFCGAVLAVLVLLSLIDSDVLLMQHVLATMTSLTLAIGLCRSMVPDATGFFNPDYLFFKYASYVDYAQVKSDRAAFATLVRDPRTRARVKEYLQYRLTAVLEELVSPLLTPLLLITVYAPAADRMVAFLHANSIRVDSLGDVCSGAHFDIHNRQHPLWTGSFTRRHDDANANAPSASTKEDELAAEKLFVSLVHFHERNPSWTPAQDEQARFLADQVRDQRTLQTSPDLSDSLFLTSMCDSVLRDEFGVGAPIRRNFESLMSATRSVMFVRDRYELNRRELADKHVQNSVHQDANAGTTLLASEDPQSISNRFTLPLDGNADDYYPPPFVHTVENTYEPPLGLDSLPCSPQPGEHLVHQFNTNGTRNNVTVQIEQQSVSFANNSLSDAQQTEDTMV